LRDVLFGVVDAPLSGCGGVLCGADGLPSDTVETAQLCTGGRINKTEKGSPAPVRSL